MMKFFTRSFVSVLVIIATAVSISAENEGTEPYETEQIRCAVCRRSIAYIWHEGVKLRTHCQSDERNHHHCDIPTRTVHDFGIDDITNGVCDQLPKTHAAIAGSEFDLIVHDDAKHTKENALKIFNVCKRWVLDEGGAGADAIAMYVFANLDARKTTEMVLEPLQNKFCKQACNPEYKLHRHVHEYEHPNAHFRERGRYYEGDT